MNFKLKLDYQIFLYIILLFIISCFFIYSSTSVSGQYAGSSSFVIKQFIFFIIGMLGMIIISKMEINHLKYISIALYCTLIISFLGLLFLPESIVRPINNARAWYQVPFIGTFQPSEFFKFPLLILTSWIIVRHIEEKRYENNAFNTLFLVFKILLLTIPPMILVYKQPDTGMIMLYMAMLFPLLFFLNIPKKILAIIMSIPPLIIGSLAFCYYYYQDFFFFFLLSVLSPHQISRINGWLDPFNYGDSAYQTRQAILAIGSGEIFGKGYLKNDVYIPEKHTDFIFANIAEEIGFVGGAIVLILYFVLLYRFVIITIKAGDLFSYLVSVGIISLLTFQVFQNVGMNIGLLPVTGITLPFLSYGGSSLISNMLLVGILLAINNSINKSIFSDDD